jgi:hypothetical protein
VEAVVLPVAKVTACRVVGMLTHIRWRAVMRTKADILAAAQVAAHHTVRSAAERRVVTPVEALSTVTPAVAPRTVVILAPVHRTVRLVAVLREAILVEVLRTVTPVVEPRMAAIQAPVPRTVRLVEALHAVTQVEALREATQVAVLRT